MDRFGSRMSNDVAFLQELSRHRQVTINTACSLPHGLSASVNIGKNVTIEPNCSIYSSIIDDDVYIGQGAVIM